MMGKMWGKHKYSWKRLQNKFTSLETLSSGSNGRALITFRGLLVRSFELQLGDWLKLLS